MTATVPLSVESVVAAYERVANDVGVHSMLAESAYQTMRAKRFAAQLVQDGEAMQRAVIARDRYEQELHGFLRATHELVDAAQALLQWNDAELTEAGALRCRQCQGVYVEDDEDTRLRGLCSGCADHSRDENERDDRERADEDYAATRRYYSS